MLDIRNSDIKNELVIKDNALLMQARILLSSALFYLRLSVHVKRVF